MDKRTPEIETILMELFARDSILCIRLTSGVLFDHGVRHDIDFT